MERRVRRTLRLWRLYLLRFEIRSAPSETQRLFLLTMGIGAICGLAAVAFHLAIEFVEARLIDRALHAGGRVWIAWTLITPMVGGLVCGALLEYVFPGARGSGIPQVKQAFASTPAVVPLRDAIGKFLVGSLQIGSGASLGREGPTVQICAGIASWFGRLASVSNETQRRLLPVGVAAGIAAAFNAPIAAVTFTIEEVVGTLDRAVLSGVIVAAALAAVIERSILGESPVFDVPGTYGLHHASSLVLYAGIGLAAGVVSIVFTESILALRVRFRRLPLLPAWTRPGLGGLMTGALAVVGLMTLRTSGITGGGYATLGEMLNGLFSWWVLLGLCGLKLLATVLSYSSGGAGGIFAPSLFIGGALGGAVGAIDAAWLGHQEDPGAFALVGMGAMFAGVIRAPITSVLIIIEMTRGYSLILPLMIANMTAYVLARRFRPQSIYEALLEQDGIKLRNPAEEKPLRVAEFLQTAQHVVLTPAMSAEEVMLRCSQGDTRHVYPVVDGEGRLVGIVTQEELGVLASTPEVMGITTAFDLMRAPANVRADDDLAQAINTMLTTGLRELPVTDSRERLIGCIDDQAVTRAYARQSSS
jgi:CIC family chloride channel protein